MWCKQFGSNPAESSLLHLPPLLVISKHKFTDISPYALHNLTFEFENLELSAKSLDEFEEYKLKCYNPDLDPSEEPINIVDYTTFNN